MLGQATSILTSSVGSGIVTAHKRLLRDKRASQGLAGGGASLLEINDDAYTASVTMILNGVNSFLYQMVLLPLYMLIALQKTIVCTSNKMFGIFDATGFVVRIGRQDLQRASDVSSGVCVSAFFEGKVNSIGETDSPDTLSKGADSLLRDAGQSASSFLVAGNAGTNQDAKSLRTLSLLSGSKLSKESGGSYVDKVPMSVRNAASQGGSKAKPLFDRFKNAEVVKKLSSVMGKLQLKAPIHLIDSLITYGIGVISGMQDMAQVSFGF
jgi:hypothetical protein